MHPKIRSFCCRIAGAPPHAIPSAGGPAGPPIQAGLCPMVSCMTGQSTPAGGPGLPQQRRLVTEIPGPASRELLARRERAVARGVSNILPVFITAAGGGVLVDADGNSLIDFGSGIAVVSVGNSAPRVAERVREQVARFTHTCFMVTPYEGYVAVCEELARHTPGSHEKRSALFNSGAEAVENAVKIARHLHPPPGHHHVRPRLPRAHQPDHGADREEHALQGQVRPVRGRDLPDADGLPAALARRPRPVRQGGPGRGHHAHPHAGGRGQRGRGDHRADPG